MYTQFYGLKDLPFRLTPDPKYLFRTESVVEALANLEYGIEAGKGIIVVSGEAGSGKTTTLRANLMSADHRVLAAYVFNPLLSTDEFFDTLLNEFNIGPQESKSAMLRALGHLLLSRHMNGLRTVVVVDEAHLLPPNLLEEIRLLSNFETNREKLLQIVLCGQPELLDILDQPEMRQFRQRVALCCRIEPLTFQETAEYIKSRLRVAGSRNDGLFEPESIELIHAASMGIPRTINNICDSALLIGFGGSRSTISADTVGEALDMHGLAAPYPQAGGTWQTTAAGPRVRRPVSFPASVPTDGGRHNVRYLRRPDSMGFGGEFDESRRVRDNVRFIIEFDGNEGAMSPGRFFSKVRVSRR